MLSPLLGEMALPSEVEVGGACVPINSDFRVGIRFEELMYDRRFSETAKIALALRLWFDEAPADVSGAIEAMLSFYRCGLPEMPDVGGSSAQLYSYRYDYGLIYAAFMQVYRLDLFDVEYLHWWRFRAMLAALPDDTQFMRVLGFRAAKVSSDMPKEQRAHLRKMKRLYALPESEAPRRVRTYEEYRAAVAAIREAKADDA